MVKRRVVTFLDEEVIEKLKEKSKKQYGKQSVYRISAALILKGLDDIEQGSGLEERDKGNAEAHRGVPWQDVLKPERTLEDSPAEPPFARRRGKR